MFWFYQDMQISLGQNNINFTSTQIRCVNLINAKNNNIIPAVFSKLNPSDNSDKLALTQIQKTWQSSLTSLLCGQFFTNPSKEFYAIELTGNDSLEKRIIGLAEAKGENKGTYELELLAVKPELTAKMKETRPIKGTGEVLLGQIFTRAKKHKSPELKIPSENDCFYKKTFKDSGIETVKSFENDITNFIINKDFFNKYIDYCKKKFKF